MVAEDLAKGAFDEVAQPGDDHHVEASAGLEMLVDILEKEIVVFIAGLRGQVGDCQGERLFIDVFESVAELYGDVADVVQGCIFCGIFDRDKILVDQQALSLRGQPGDCQAQRAVAAAEVNRPVILSDIEIVEQQARTLVDAAGRKQSPGSVKAQMLPLERVAEVDLFAQLGNFFLIQGQ